MNKSVIFLLSMLISVLTFAQGSSSLFEAADIYSDTNHSEKNLIVCNFSDCEHFKMNKLRYDARSEVTFYSEHFSIEADESLELPVLCNGSPTF